MQTMTTNVSVSLIWKQMLEILPYYTFVTGLIKSLLLFRNCFNISNFEVRIKDSTLLKAIDFPSIIIVFFVTLYEYLT